MERSIWLARYRARILIRRPEISADELDEIAGIEAFRALAPHYPGDPERAVDEGDVAWTHVIHAPSSDERCQHDPESPDCTIAFAGDRSWAYCAGCGRRWDRLDMRSSAVS